MKAISKILILLLWASTANAQYLQDWQLTGTAALPVEGLPASTQLSVILPALDQGGDIPLRMSASTPTLDSKLHFSASDVQSADGSYKSMSPAGSTAPLFVASTIDYQAATTTGGTIQVDGSTFGLPACSTSPSPYTRQVFSYFASTNTMNSHFSSFFSTQAGLPDPGTLFSGLTGGSPVGYIDLQCTATGQYKTANSSTSIVQNAVSGTATITNFAGRGGGGVSSITLTGDVTGSGTSSITTTLAATSNATLTTLSALTTASSLASIGTVTSGTWQGTAVGVLYGGTGSSSASGARTNLSAAASGSNSDITSLSGLTTPLSPPQGGTGVANNSASTITISGSYGLTETLTNTTSVTLPTSGTLATLAGSESLSNKTLGSSDTLTGSVMASFSPDGSHTLTAPVATDTLADLAGIQTLTNKTMDGGSNTFTNLSLTSSVTGILPVANGGTNSATSLSSNRFMVSSSGSIVEASAVTANAAVASDSNGLPTASSTTATELGYVHGVTSSIQTQLGTYLPLGGGTMTGALVLSGDATQALNPVSYQQFNAAVFGLSSKDAVAVCSCAANITLAGEQTIDGILTSSSPILVTQQTASATNGIYVTSSGAWTRRADSNSWVDVTGAIVTIDEGGTTYGGTVWLSTAAQGGTLGVTAITYAQMAGAGTYTADGTNVLLTGHQFSLNNPIAVNTTGTAANVTGTVAAGNGGTGQTSNTSNGVLYGQGSSAILATSQGTANSILTANAGAPSFSQTPVINTSAEIGVNGTSGTTGTLKLDYGATNGASISVINGGATSAYNFNLPTGAGTSGQAMLSGGGNSSPMTFGTLGVAAGGTGLGTLTTGNVILGAGTSTPTFVAPSTAGNVLASNGSTWVSTPPFTDQNYSGSTTSLTTTQSFTSTTLIDVWVNGQLGLEGSDWSRTTPTTITISDPLTSTSSVRVREWN